MSREKAGGRGARGGGGEGGRGNGKSTVAVIDKTKTSTLKKITKILCITANSAALAGL